MKSQSADLSNKRNHLASSQHTAISRSMVMIAFNITSKIEGYRKCKGDHNIAPFGDWSKVANAKPHYLN